MYFCVQMSKILQSICILIGLYFLRLVNSLTNDAVWSEGVTAHTGRLAWLAWPDKTNNVSR